jgi:putative FmdB family regulatory protein
MPEYPYACEDCGNNWTVFKPMAEASKPATCPACKTSAPHQNYAAKTLNGGVSTEGDWSGGKKVFQLHPSHPDSVVTSKSQMEKVYRKHGISLDTGHFTSKEAQVAATLPVSKRKGLTDSTVVGGVETPD